MSANTTYSPDFQRFLQLVETALAQAAIDARELAERTGTPLVVREARRGDPQEPDGENTGAHQ